MEIKVIAIIGIIIILSILIIRFANKPGSRSAPSKSLSSEQDIIDALKDGNKIEAIKHYRYVHGVGLKEAKQAVEKINENL